MKSDKGIRMPFTFDTQVLLHYSILNKNEWLAKKQRRESWKR
jgi:hypothetical protein